MSRGKKFLIGLGIFFGGYALLIAIGVIASKIDNNKGPDVSKQVATVKFKNNENFEFSLKGSSPYWLDNEYRALHRMDILASTSEDDTNSNKSTKVTLASAYFLKSDNDLDLLIMQEQEEGKIVVNKIVDRELSTISQKDNKAKTENRHFWVITSPEYPENIFVITKISGTTDRAICLMGTDANILLDIISNLRIEKFTPASTSKSNRKLIEEDNSIVSEEGRFANLEVRNCSIASSEDFPAGRVIGVAFLIWHLAGFVALVVFILSGLGIIFFFWW